MKKGRNGFTLVELLIVIVVIGILSAMMMFSSTEAVSSAKAAKIIGDMTQLKKAINSWYLDNLDKIKLTGSGTTSEYKIVTANNKEGIYVSDFVKDYNSEFLKYISNEKTITLRNRKATPNIGDYALTSFNHSRQWYICCYLGNKPSRLKEKIAGRQKTTGLLGVSSSNMTNNNYASKKFEDNNIYTNQDFACMLVLDLGD